MRFGVKLELLAGLAMKLVEVGRGEGDADHAGHARRRHRDAVRDFDALVKAAEPSRSSARATRGRIRSTSTRG